MPLAPGARLGLYRIVDTLGEGGMDVVYRARDTRLDRDVAVKVLSESFASDPPLDVHQAGGGRDDAGDTRAGTADAGSRPIGSRPPLPARFGRGGLVRAMIERREPFAIIFASTPQLRVLRVSPRWPKLARMMNLPDVAT